MLQIFWYRIYYNLKANTFSCTQQAQAIHFTLETTQYSVDHSNISGVILLFLINYKSEINYKTLKAIQCTNAGRIGEKSLIFKRVFAEKGNQNTLFSDNGRGGIKHIPIPLVWSCIYVCTNYNYFISICME